MEQSQNRQLSIDGLFINLINDLSKRIEDACPPEIDELDIDEHPEVYNYKSAVYMIKSQIELAKEIYSQTFIDEFEDSDEEILYDEDVNDYIHAFLGLTNAVGRNDTLLQENGGENQSIDSDEEDD